MTRKHTYTGRPVINAYDPNADKHKPRGSAAIAVQREAGAAFEGEFSRIKR